MQFIVFFGIIYYFCGVKEWKIDILASSSALPEWTSEDFFHSRQLFLIYEQTPRHSPYMVVARDEGGKIVACLLAVVRARGTWIPPFIYWHCRIYGEGAYDDSLEKAEKEQIFGNMIHAITQRMRLRVFYIELSNLSTKMFGYRELRSEGYFPVAWMSIHNSLHSKPAEERIDYKMKKKLANAVKRGAITEEVSCDADLDRFIKLLHNHNLLKPKRYIPSNKFFHLISKSENCHLLLTKYKSKAIGCAALIYSGGNAYLWYSAFLRKTYMKLHPDDITLWNAIKKAQNDGCAHIVFLDVGLPFQRNSLRDFILRFGGKPMSTYRWFFFTNSWLNKLSKWLTRG